MSPKKKRTDYSKGRFIVPCDRKKLLEKKEREEEKKFNKHQERICFRVERIISQDFFIRKLFYRNILGLWENRRYFFIY